MTAIFHLLDVLLDIALSLGAAATALMAIRARDQDRTHLLLATILFVLLVHS